MNNIENGLQDNKLIRNSVIVIVSLYLLVNAINDLFDSRSNYSIANAMYFIISITILSAIYVIKNKVNTNYKRILKWYFNFIAISRIIMEIIFVYSFIISENIIFIVFSVLLIIILIILLLYLNFLKKQN